MDIIFTPDYERCEAEIRSCLRNEPLFSPKEKTLDFIKNFARNFRADKGVEANIKEFVLN